MFIEWFDYGAEHTRHAVQVRDQEDWREALARSYRRVHPSPRGRSAKSVGLSQHFAGGDTWHVQMGYPLPERQFTLDPVIVVHVPA